MTEFDIQAAGWDQNQMHWDRSAAIVKSLLNQVPVKKEWKILEFGAGTGITSFLLKDHASETVMMDTSAEMVRIMNEKVIKSGTSNLKPLLFDLEKEEWTGEKFNLLITQMVLHHVIDVEHILKKFYEIILPGGYLAISDLYPEDGSFHGKGFIGHKGFDINGLSDMLRETGFANISSGKCFSINRTNEHGLTKSFDLFLLIAYRPDNHLL